MLGGASDAELTDLREEMSMTEGRASTTPSGASFSKPSTRRGVTCIFQNAGEESKRNAPAPEAALAVHVSHRPAAKTSARRRSGRDDVAAAKKAGKICLAFTTNGVPLARSVMESTRDELRQRPALQTAWRADDAPHLQPPQSALGDGCGEPSDAGISDFGRARHRRTQPSSA
jgi:membrane dipeptidase